MSSLSWLKQNSLFFKTCSLIFFGIFKISDELNALVIFDQSKFFYLIDESFDI